MLGSHDSDRSAGNLGWSALDGNDPDQEIWLNPEKDKRSTLSLRSERRPHHTLPTDKRSVMSMRDNLKGTDGSIRTYVHDFKENMAPPDDAQHSRQQSNEDNLPEADVTFDHDLENFKHSVTDGLTEQLNQTDLTVDSRLGDDSLAEPEVRMKDSPKDTPEAALDSVVEHPPLEPEDDSILPSARPPLQTEPSFLDNSDVGLDSQLDSSKLSSSMMIERDMEKLLDIETSLHRPDSSFIPTPSGRDDFLNSADWDGDHLHQLEPRQSQSQFPSSHKASTPPQAEHRTSPVEQENADDDVRTPRPVYKSQQGGRTTSHSPSRLDEEGEELPIQRALSQASLALERSPQNAQPVQTRLDKSSSQSPSRVSAVISMPDSKLLHSFSMSSLNASNSIDIGDLPPSTTASRSELSVTSSTPFHPPTGLRQPSSASYFSNAPSTPRPNTGVRDSARELDPPETVVSKLRDGDRDRRSGSAVRIGSISSIPGTTSRHSLTLKEQNITIDKLTKENFDLKLKIHFLDQALQKRSDEGLGELVQENVQLQTDLANERKESLALRKRAREAERRARIVDEELRELKQTAAAAAAQSRQADAEEVSQLREETRYLREQVEHSELTIRKLRTESLEKEVEKRRMAEVVRMMQSADSVARERDGKGVEEAMEMWKDLLSAETARREQADEDTLWLRAEVSRLQAELNAVHNRSEREGDSHTIHSGLETSTATSNAQTLVEKLQHENAELRRDLGAQTSMLTSRNRERERLQAEIEDLKLASRRVLDGHGGGRSIAGDSIFERSVSRAGPGGRESHGSGPTGASAGLLSELEQERDELEQRLCGLRDEVAQTKLLNQDLERELNGHLDLLQRAERENETMAQQLAELDGQLNEISRDREELLAALHEREEAAERLQADAVLTIEGLEEDCRAREAEIERLAVELQRKNDDFEALQAEMAEITRSVLCLEDERAEARARIQSLDAELDAANGELETLDKRVRELSGKSERLEVQLESHQAEIGFLREEQEADKIKIGGLEAALVAANTSLEQEKARAREIEEQRADEAKRMEALNQKEKAEAERAFANLSRRLSEAETEARKLQSDLSDAETDRANWRRQFDDLDANVRAVLDGSFSGERDGVLREITILQTALTEARETISYLKSTLNERELMIRDRDDIVERAGLELQTGTSALEKEKRALHQARIRIDQLQVQNQNYADTVKSYEARVRKLEAAQRRDKDQISGLESQLQSKYTSQTTLLLNLWHRLSSLCGTDWAQKNCLIEGQALPTVESINKNLPGFSKNILLAIKTIEGMVKGFRERLKTIERDLWKDYQTLEHAMDARTQKLDKLELVVNQLQFLPQSVRQSTYGGNSSSRAIVGSSLPYQPGVNGTPSSGAANSGSSSAGAGHGQGSNGNHTNSAAEAALRRENLMLHARLAELQQQSQQHNSSPDFRSSRSTPTSGSRIPTSSRNASSSMTSGGNGGAGSLDIKSPQPLAPSALGLQSGLGLGLGLGGVSGPARGRHTNNPSYSSSGTPLPFDPLATVPGHQSRPSIDYTSTSNPPQTLSVSAGGGNGSHYHHHHNLHHHQQQPQSQPHLNSHIPVPISTNPHPYSQSHSRSDSQMTSPTDLTSPPLTSVSSVGGGGGPGGGGPTGGHANLGLGISGATASGINVAGSGSGGAITQADLARAALCHEFLQQAKEERGLRAMERSNARRRLLEKEGR